MVENIKLTEMEEKVILAMAECGMNSQAVANKLHYHVNTLYYHIAQIREITGLNPRDFYDLNKLLRMCVDTSWTEKMAL